MSIPARRILWIVVALVLVAAAVPVANLVVGLPDSPLRATRAGDPHDARAIEVVATKCAQCHAATPALPYYARWPVAEGLITRDVRNAARHVDYLAELRLPDRAVSEAVLAKTERVVHEGSMPPLRFRMLHWDHALGAEERQALLDWAVEERVRFHADPALPPEIQRLALRPVPARVDADPAKVELGRRLFHDPRLSGDDTVSCASCHALDKGGTDRARYSTGVGGAVGGINSPTVFNSGLQFVQFWDGRATTLDEQADGPVNNPIEMASNWPEAIAKLSADRDFRRSFEAVYPAGIDKDSLIDAIATFERTLVTPNSAFDRHLRGDGAALSADEKRGLALFDEYACGTCHVGAALGGRSFETMGLRVEYFVPPRETTPADEGRFHVTQDPADRHRFKVPMLRNVAVTAPYLHDGSTSDLTEVVQLMARHQLGREMPAEDARLVAAFLATLTGEYEGRLLQ